MSNHPSHINWGIIGCGNVTEVKSGPAFNKVPASSLVAVMRRDEEKVKDYAQRHGVKKWYTDAAQLINDPEVNAIYVATPPKYHEEYAVAALQAGKPVYVEKPMSTDVASCIRMQQAAEQSGGKLSIAHYRRGLPMFAKIKSLLNEHAIGAIRSVRLSMLQPDKSSIIADSAVNWRVDPAIAGAGLFYDLAPHQLDLVVHFFGEPIETFGMSANQAKLYPAEDIVTGLMKLPGDILFSGRWCFTVDENDKEDLIEIHGSTGKITFPVFGQQVTLTQNGVTTVLPFTPPTHIQQPMIERVTQYFLGKGDNPCSAADALISMRAMESFVYGNRETLQ